MMALLRDIWSDLVEKRLWPVAALLLALMVATPVLLGGGSEAAPAPAVPARVPAGTEPASRPVSLDQAPAQPAPRGRYKDPFAGGAQPAGVVVGATGAPPAPAPPAPAGPGPSAAPAPSSSPEPAPAPSPAPSVTPDPAPSVTPDPAPAPARPAGVFAGYRVDLQWGRAGAARRMRDVIRLGRLVAGEEPLLVYFGVRREGDRALFLVARDAAAVGDGRCMPSTKSCQVIELRAGESQFFDVETAGGALTQYELDIDRIVERRADSRPAAERLRERESKLGRRLMYDAIERGRDYSTNFMYRSSLGAVVRDVKATVSWFRQATYAEVDAEPAQ